MSTQPMSGVERPKLLTGRDAIVDGLWDSSSDQRLTRGTCDPTDFC